MASKKKNKPKSSLAESFPDPVLISIVMVLVCVGTVIIASASSARAEDLHGDSAFFFIRHLKRVILGILGMMLFSRINYQKLKYWGFPLMVISVGMLIYLLIPGCVEPIKGSKRFLPLMGQSVQPAEIVKLALVIFLADSVTRRGEDLKTPPGYLTRLFIIGGVCALILFQPDFSTAFLMALIGIHALYLGGARIKHLFNTGLAVAPAAVIAAMSAPYRIRRLDEYIQGILHPEKVSHHLNQSLIALGDGGIFGLGPGKSYQKEFYLPEPFTDFVFSILGEELGFFGTSLTVVLFIVIAVRGIKIARRAPDHFGFVLAGSITFIIASYAIVNLMVVTGIIPISGLPLPFLTYGGSSLVITMSMVGILLNISRYAVKSSQYQYRRKNPRAGN